MKKNLPQIQNLTRMNPESLKNSCLILNKIGVSIVHHTLEGEPRKRIANSTVCTHLPAMSDKLLFILSYLKNNPLQEYHAACFGMTQPQANALIHSFSEILLKISGRFARIKSFTLDSDTETLHICYS